MKGMEYRRLTTDRILKQLLALVKCPYDLEFRGALEEECWLRIRFSNEASLYTRIQNRRLVVTRDAVIRSLSWACGSVALFASLRSVITSAQHCNPLCCPTIVYFVHMPHTRNRDPYWQQCGCRKDRRASHIDRTVFFKVLLVGGAWAAHLSLMFSE